MKNSLLDDRTSILKVFVLIIFSILATREITLDQVNYGSGFWMCLDYIKTGTLYGGQLFCAQAPFIYYFGYFISALFGVGAINVVFPLTSIALDAAVLYLVFRIARLEGVSDWFAILLSFIVLVYPASISHTDVMFGTLFLLAGFYCLWYYKGRYRGFLSGVSFFLSLMCKFNVVPALAVILLGYTLKAGLIIFHKGRFKFKLNPGLIMTALTPLLWITILTLILWVKYPLFFTYTFYAPLTDPYYESYIPALISLLTAKTHYVAAYIMLAGFAYAFYKRYYAKGAIYPLMAVIGFYGILLPLQKAHGRLEDVSYYGIPIYLFAVLALLFLQKKSKALFAILFVVIVLCPSLNSNFITDAKLKDANSKALEFRNTIEYGMHYIPPQQGRVLIEGTTEYTRELIERFDIPMSMNDVDVVEATGYDVSTSEDPDTGPRLRKLLNSTSEDVNQPYGNLTKAESKLRDEIINGKYSLIIYGPPLWSAVQRVVISLPQEVKNQYCVVKVPNFLYYGSGLSYTELVFHNKKDCSTILSGMRGYYSEKFDYICSKSQIAANVVYMTLKEHGISLNVNCQSRAAEEENYKYDNERITAGEMMITLILFLFFHWVFQSKETRDSRALPGREHNKRFGVRKDR